MQKKAIIIAAAVILLAIAGWYGYRAYQHRSIVSQAESMMRSGDYSGVVSFLQGLVTPDTVDPEKRLLLGKAHYRLGGYDQAQEILDPLLRYGQEQPDALAVSGWIWLKKEQYLRAKERFDSLVIRGLGGESLQNAGLGAVAFVRSEGFRASDLDEARSLLGKALESDPKITEARMYLTEYYLAQRQYDEAIGEAQEAAGLQPFWWEPHVLLGRCYLADGQYSKAEESFKNGLQYGASEIETNYYLARSQYRQGKLTEALAVFEQLAQQDDPIALKAGEDAAKIHIVYNRLDEAVRLLEKVNEDRLYSQPAMQLYELYTRMDQPEKAEKILLQVIAQWPLSGDAQLETGNQLLESGNADKAFDAFQNALDDDAANAWANYNIGFAAAQLGQFNQAVDFFEIAVRHAEEYLPAKINMAFSQLAVGRELEGRTVLQEVMYKHKDNPVALLAYALDRFLSGYPEVTLEAIDQSLKANPGQAVPFIIRGEVFLRLFDFERAMSGFQQALTLDADNIRALLGLAHASYRFGQWQEAENIYTSLLSVKDQLSQSLLVEVQNGNALILARKEDYAGAMDIWSLMKNSTDLGRQLAVVNSAVASGSQMSEMVRDDVSKGLMEPNPLPESGYNYAVVSEQLGLTQDAVDAYEKLVNDFPTYLPGMFNLAALYEKIHRFERSVMIYEQAYKAAPERMDVQNNLAAVYARVDEFAKSEEQLVSAAERAPGTTILQFNRGLLALKQENRQAADKIRAQLVENNGNNEDTRLLDGLISAQSGDWKSALQTFEQAVDSGDTNPYTYINYSAALSQNGRFAEAEEILLKALQAHPQVADVHRAAGLLYCRTGLYDDAAAALRRARDLDPSLVEVNDMLETIESWMN